MKENWKTEKELQIKTMFHKIDLKTMFGDVMTEEQINNEARRLAESGMVSLGEELIKKGQYEVYNVATGQILYTPGRQ